MPEQVRVAGTTVTQGKLERIFTELTARHWLGIPAGYQPRLERFRPVGAGPTASLEEIVYTYMAQGTFPDWFKEQFVWPTPDPTVKRLF